MSEALGRLYVRGYRELQVYNLFSFLISNLGKRSFLGITPECLAAISSFFDCDKFRLTFSGHFPLHVKRYEDFTGRVRRFFVKKVAEERSGKEAGQEQKKG